MLSDEELLELLVDLESDRVERKSSLSEREKIRETICAFTNDLPDHQKPGVLFIGVRDDGSCVGLPITDELLRTIAHWRDDGTILPLPAMTVQKRTFRGCEMAVVVVQPSEFPPVRYKSKICVRVGPRRGYATAEEERRLTERRRAAILPFDQQAVRGATLDDLDLDFFRRHYLPSTVSPEILVANDRSLEQQLASLRFLTRDGTPNVGAVLVLGKDPRQWLAGAYVQFLRIDGGELTDPIRHQRELAGPMADTMRQLDELLEANISVSVDIRSSPIEQRRPDYPIVALQQLCRNAVLHRSYEATNSPVRIYWFQDRVEIFSPGGPYGQVNRSNFGQPGVTDYRNPLLAEAMKVLGYVQRFGVGIPLAQSELRKNGNPAATFQVESQAVLVTVRRRP